MIATLDSKTAFSVVPLHPHVVTYRQFDPAVPTLGTSEASTSESRSSLSSAISQAPPEALSIISGGASGPFIGHAPMAQETLLIVLIAVVLAGVAAILLLCRFRPTVSPVELLRWGFLIMLPAAIVVSVAAWPGLRTLSLFRILYVLLCLGTAVWFLLNRKLPSNLHVRGFLLFLGFWVAWALV